MVLPRLTLVAAVLGALVLACGGGVEQVPYAPVDCCVSKVHYVCNTPTSAGMCLSDTPDPRYCAQQAGPCPPTAP